MKQKVISFIELLDLLHTGYRVEVRVTLCGGLYSRHELSLDDDDSVIDFSYVDSEETIHTPTEFTRSIVAQAAKKNGVVVEQQWLEA